MNKHIKIFLIGTLAMLTIVSLFMIGMHALTYYPEASAYVIGFFFLLILTYGLGLQICE